MKINNIKILSVLLVLTIAFTGCKYEDGPFMSLRQKRDRVSQIWKFTKVTLDDNDITNSYNQSNFMISFDVYKAGSFGFSLRDLDGKILGRSSDSSSNSAHQDASNIASSDSIPFFYRGGGKWTFIDNYNSLQLDYDLAYNEDEEPRTFEIKELRKKKMKLSGIDELSGKTLVLEFEPAL